MSDRSRTAKAMLAVQAALRDSQPRLEPGSVEILESLRDQSRPIGEVTGSSQMGQWTAMSTLLRLERSGLVEVDKDADTVAITNSGRAALAT